MSLIGRWARVGAAATLMVVIAAACSSGEGDARSSATMSDRSTKPTTTASEAPSRRSAGCGQPSTPVDAAKETMKVDGTDRWYLLDVPAAATKSPAPVVVDLHGASEGAELHHKISNFAALGRKEGFITVTPQGRGSAPFFDARPGSTDVAFVESVLDQVEEERCVDLDRVYAAGFSNGAFLSSVLTCDLADRFAAVALVAGIRDVPDCNPSRPVPAIAFHGTADEWIRFGGGESAKAAEILLPPEWTGPKDRPGINAMVPGPFEPIPDIVAAWADGNGCDGEPTESTASSDTTLVSYRCPKGADVDLYRTTGAGHSWPGSEMSAQLEAVTGKATMTIDATDLIWSFFSAHPLEH